MSILYTCIHIAKLVCITVNKSCSAIADMTAHCCTMPSFAARCGVPATYFNTLSQIIAENIAKNHTLPKVDSLGYILVADGMGLTSTTVT